MSKVMAMVTQKWTVDVWTEVEIFASNRNGGGERQRFEDENNRVSNDDTAIFFFRGIPVGLDHAMFGQSFGDGIVAPDLVHATNSSSRFGKMPEGFHGDLKSTQ